MTMLAGNLQRRVRDITREKYFPCRGGLNLVDPPITLDPGEVIASKNYEAVDRGGYRRIQGYEQFDGRPSPYETSYWLIQYDGGNTERPGNRDTITMLRSGVVFEVLSAAVLESGNFAGGDAAGYIPAMVTSGDPELVEDNEGIDLNGNTVAYVDGGATENSASTDALHTTYRNDAILQRQKNIEKPAGKGRVRGVWGMDGVVYAFRNDETVSKSVMFKSTDTGWEEVNLGRYLEFDAGDDDGPFLEGDIVTGLTSGASGTVLRVAHRSGDWAAPAGNTAVGRLTFASVTNGPFQDDEELQVDGTTYALANGVDVANELPAIGDENVYQFITHNFYGHDNTRAIYGVNGEGQAFEYRPSDGAFTFVVTGMTDDKPTHVQEHKNFLFLAFSGGSLQHSSVADPIVWNAVLGSTELAVGDEITGMVREIGNVLAVFTRNDTHLLYGTSASDWDLQQLHSGTGARNRTVQKMAVGWGLDDRGITNIAATQAYGDFKQNAVSEKVDPFLRYKETLQSSPRMDTAHNSVVSRRKNQYRIFFGDKTGLYVTIENNKVMGIMPVELNQHVRCICSVEDENGAEHIYFGAGNGFVYEMDKGNGFGQAAIDYYIAFSYHHYGTPQANKLFDVVELEIDGPYNDGVLTAIPDYSYGDPDVPQSREYSMLVKGDGGLWDIDRWNEFIWSSQIVASSRLKIDGFGNNMSLLVYGETEYVEPHTIQGMTVSYRFRSRRR